MSRDDIHHLAAAYALDALDVSERAAFEAHYRDCDVCRLDVDEYRATLAELAQAHAVEPDPALKHKVMAQIAQTRQFSPAVVDALEARSRRRSTVTRVALAAAAALILLVLGGVATTLWVEDSGFDRAAGEVLAQSDAQLAVLQGSAPGGFRVAWSSRLGRAVVIGDGLSDAGAGRAYELWLIDATGPRPMQLLERASDGSVRRVLDVAGTPLAWGVTIEPANGSPLPTGEVIFQAAV